MRPDSKTATIYALKNGTLYEVTYSAHSGLYNDYLPVAKKIIESLTISTLSWRPDILGEILMVMDDQKDLRDVT